MKKIIALLLVLAMALSLVACGGGEKPAETKAPEAGNNETTPVVEPTNTPDTIVIMAPPVTGEYLNNLKVWAADFNKMYPHLTVEIIETSWGDHNDKLSTMAQAGEAPDIAEVSSGVIGTFVEMGVAIDISKYLAADRLADYDANAME